MATRPRWAGQVVLLPTDTVYGLAVDACREAPARRLYKLKNRPETMPVALLAGELDAILDAVPEARGRAAVAARALLPGPYTLVLPNPARRFRWLCGTTPEAIGIRVPDLPPEAQAVVDRLGFVAATSANLHGGADPARLEDVPRELLDGCGAVVDAGELPGTPSTVVDLTGPEPVVLREGAVSAPRSARRRDRRARLAPAGDARGLDGRLDRAHRERVRRQRGRDGHAPLRVRPGCERQRHDDADPDRRDDEAGHAQRGGAPEPPRAAEVRVFADERHEHEARDGQNPQTPHPQLTRSHRVACPSRPGE